MVASFHIATPPGLSPKGLWLLLQEDLGSGSCLIGLLETPFQYFPIHPRKPSIRPWRSSTEALGEAGKKEATREEEREPLGG